MMRRNLLAALAALAVMAMVVAIALVASRGSDAPVRTENQLPAGGPASTEPDPGDQPTGSAPSDVVTDPAAGARGGASVPGYTGSAPSTTPRGSGHTGNSYQLPGTFAISDAHVDAKGRLVLGYFVGLPSCYAQLDHVETVQTATKVTVTLVQGPEPQVAVGVACPDIAMAKSVRLTLTSPLGGRSLVDGSNGNTVRVR
jgi:hypothetical protein